MIIIKWWKINLQIEKQKIILYVQATNKVDAIKKAIKQCTEFISEEISFVNILSCEEHYAKDDIY